jgi:dephospho-CoA kinase
VSFTFRPALREQVGLLIGVAGGTGSGKTYSAMRMASGISGDKPFAVIDTEAGRAKHYAEAFRFDHGDLKPPFRPQSYAEAIEAADKAGYQVIVVDSVSHVWAGDGGVLDWQEDELGRMAGDDWKKREAVKMAAWIKPKMAHKAMVQKLLQVRAHLILCFRAEQKIEMVRGDDGKMKIVAKQSLTGLDGWIPVTEKMLPFELTASFLLTADAPGMPKPIKLQEQHRALFPLDKPINEDSGKRIAAWAKGSAAPRVSPPPPPLPEPAGAADSEYADERDLSALRAAFADCDKGAEAAFLKVAKARGIETLDKLAATDIPGVHEWIARRKQKSADGAKAT